MEKRLYKVEKGKILCGVCAGLAKYFNIDVTLIRLIWAIFCVMGGSGILIYILAAIIMPNEYDI